MSARAPEPCDGLRGEHTGPIRFYRTGWKCSAHSPWAEAGQDEPQPGPGMPAGAWTTPTPASASAYIDNKAIASGKRRASRHVYEAARAALGRTPAPAPGIRLDPGQPDARGGWIRIPTADYTCPACHQTESASGDQVAHFAAHIETEHRERCTANPQGAQAR